jgi:Flp pilus assembly protein TadD
MFEGCGARAGLPSEEAAANVTHLRQMLAQQNGWEPQAESGSQTPGS